MLLAGLALCAILGAVPSPGGGAEPDAELGRGVIARDASLRAQPYSLGSPVAALPGGTPVVVLERRGYWLRVRADEPPSEGWVRIIRVRYDPRPEETAPASGPDRGSQGLFSSLARSAAGWLGRSRSAPRETTTIGIRGLSAEELRTALPDPSALQRLERVGSSPAAARAFAQSGELVANPVALPTPAGHAPPASGLAGEGPDSRM